MYKRLQALAVILSCLALFSAQTAVADSCSRDEFPVKVRRKRPLTMGNDSGPTVTTICFGLIELKQSCTSVKASLRDIGQLGFRPATLEELVDFGTYYPDEYKRHPVVAVGSILQTPNGHLVVPYLYFLDNNQVHRFHFYWLGGVWDRWCPCGRFLVVRK